MAHSLVTWGENKRVLHFPVIMPLFLTSFAFLNKYLLDLRDRQKSARELGRELVAYTVVDWAVFWKFGGELTEVAVEMAITRRQRLAETIPASPREFAIAS